MGEALKKSEEKEYESDVSKLIEKKDNVIFVDFSKNIGDIVKEEDDSEISEDVNGPIKNMEDPKVYSLEGSINQEAERIYNANQSKNVSKNFYNLTKPIEESYEEQKKEEKENGEELITHEEVMDQAETEAFGQIMGFSSQDSDPDKKERYKMRLSADKAYLSLVLWELNMKGYAGDINLGNSI
jgi:hypothetical protein